MFCDSCGIFIIIFDVNCDMIKGRILRELRED